ncbi:exonuclease SbcCD subunit D [soil metagenome]
MKVLHTSDWHLGRMFHGAALLDDQARALDRVVEVAAEARVDAVLVSGDLYDRAVPPADAVDLLGDVLRRLTDLGTCVVAITGNHDSPGRVGALDPVLRAEVTLRGRFRPDAPVVVPDRDGGPDLVIHPVPYLEPLAARPDERAPVGRTRAGDAEPATRSRRATQHQVLAHALDAVRANLAARGAIRSVVVAHDFVAGAAPSASERELSVGGVDRVPLDVFDGISYAALGHLHRPQALTERIAYAGSLLPYSFSETAPSSIRLIDVAPDGAVASEVVALGVERPVATLVGRLDEVLADPAHAGAEGSWVRAQLIDEVLPRHAMARLRDRFPHAVVLEHRSPTRTTVDEDIRTRGDGTTDLELAQAFVADRLGRPAEEPEAALLAQAFDVVTACRRDPGPIPVVASDDGPGTQGAVA